MSQEMEMRYLVLFQLWFAWIYVICTRLLAAVQSEVTCTCVTKPRTQAQQSEHYEKPHDHFSEQKMNSTPFCPESRWEIETLKGQMAPNHNTAGPGRLASRAFLHMYLKRPAVIRHEWSETAEGFTVPLVVHWSSSVVYWKCSVVVCAQRTCICICRLAAMVVWICFDVDDTSIFGQPGWPHQWEECTWPPSLPGLFLGTGRVSSWSECLSLVGSLESLFSEGSDNHWWTLSEAFWLLMLAIKKLGLLHPNEGLFQNVDSTQTELFDSGCL